MEKFCIVIPIYKEPTAAEKLSLSRLYNITQGKYNIYFVKPESLVITKLFTTNIDEYNKEYENNIHYISFNDEYFISTESYSKLLETCDFWNSFINYEYVYIYQLDCYIIKDDLEYWANLGFDYIGAPIVSKNANWKNTPAIGNGGFSLRKVSKFIELTDENGWFIKKYGENLKNNKWLKFEDLYFLQECGGFTKIDTPIFQDAIRFAWDMNPDVIYKLTQNLPMCIHAFDKNIPFWKDKLEGITSEVYSDSYSRNKSFIDAYYG